MYALSQLIWYVDNGMYTLLCDEDVLYNMCHISVCVGIIQLTLCDLLLDSIW